MGARSAKATLRISGPGVRSAEFTRILGIEPSITWKKGEEYVNALGQKCSRYNGLWLYESKGHIVSEDPLAHFDYIMKVFSDKKSEFQKIKQFGNVQIDVGLMWEVSHGNYEISAKQLRDVLNLGLDGINHIFIGIDEDEEEEEEGS